MCNKKSQFTLKNREADEETRTPDPRITNTLAGADCLPEIPDSTREIAACPTPSRKAKAGQSTDLGSVWVAPLTGQALFDALSPHVRRIVSSHFRGHPLRDDLVAVALERLWEILPRIDLTKTRQEQIHYCSLAGIRAAQDELRSPRQRVIKVEDLASGARRPAGPRSTVVSVRIPAGRRRVLEAIAEGRAQTLNDWLKQAIDEKLEREVKLLGLSAAP